MDFCEKSGDKEKFPQGFMWGGAATAN